MPLSPTQQRRMEAKRHKRLRRIYRRWLYPETTSVSVNLGWLMGAAMIEGFWQGIKPGVRFGKRPLRNEL